MPKFFLFIIILHCNAISYCNDTPSEIEKYAITCKVWGFLKYYHPAVATGIFDWDNALIKILPHVEIAKSWSELNQLAYNSIKSLGPIKKSDDGNEIANYLFDDNWFDANFDLSWTDNPNTFSQIMINELNFIEENRNQQKNYYASGNFFNPAVNVKNEKTDTAMLFPNRKYRLLDLFRYWNIVEYFFPYKYQMDQNWDSVLIEMIPKFNDAKDTLEYHLLLLNLVVKLNDSHAYLKSDIITKYKWGKYIPVMAKKVENSILIYELLNKNLAKINDLKIGDIITHINKVPVFEIIHSNWEYLPASNISVKYRSAQRLILCHAADSILVRYDRAGRFSEKYIKCYSIEELNYTSGGAVIEKCIQRYSKNKLNYTRGLYKPSWEFMKNNIGYVNMGILANREIDLMMKSFHACTGIIFDLRNYPNETADSIIKYLNPNPNCYGLGALPDFKYPGRYKWKQYCFPKTMSDSSKLYTRPIVVLINEMTQSQAECTAMIFQTYSSCTLIGSQTAGADGETTIIKFIGGIETRMTGKGIFYSDTTITQRIGIVPDIFIEPTIAGIRAGKDEILEFAVSYLLEKK